MINLASFLPLTRLLAYTSHQQREHWAAFLARRTVQRGGSRVRRAREHLQLAFPEAEEEQIQGWLSSHFIHRYRQLLNLAWLRYASIRAICDSVTSSDGVELLKSYSSRGRGVIVATPHFGDWERFNLVMGTHVDAAVLYKPSTNQAADRWLCDLRQRTGVHALPVGRQAIREVYRRLSQGGIVGILPDQVPGQAGGLKSEFLGRPVTTMSLIHRLVQSTGCAVMVGRCFYKSAVSEHNSGSTYQLKITLAPDEVEDFDPLVSVRAMDGAVESVLKEAIPQYLWTYKRWK